MRRFCEALPEDRLLGDKTDALSAILEKDGRKRQYKIEKTGATLTYHSAITVLARYASSLVSLSLGASVKAVDTDTGHSNTKITRPLYILTMSRLR
jgi:hypothetical protein